MYCDSLVFSNYTTLYVYRLTGVLIICMGQYVGFQQNIILCFVYAYSVCVCVREGHGS